ncbi:hypothetical protein BH20ACI2_BH20ACI2_09230 [soil metagenome]
MVVLMIHYGYAGINRILFDELQYIPQPVLAPVAIIAFFLFYQRDRYFPPLKFLVDRLECKHLPILNFFLRP